jgi:MFS family permease
MAAVFANPGLRRVTLAFGGSAIGDWAYATAVTVWAYDVGGASAVGVWAVVRWLLLALVTPLASMLADRLPRKLVMVSTDLVRAVLIAGAAALVHWHAPVYATFVVATLATLAGAPFRPALYAILPSLSRSPRELTAVNGLTSTVESLSFFVGPAMAGILLSITEPPAVFLVDVVSFLWSAALVVGIRSAVAVPQHTGGTSVDPSEGGNAASGADDTEAAATQTDESGLLSETLAGFRTIWSAPDLRLVTSLICAQTVVAGASGVFTIALAAHFSALGPQGVGYLDATLGVGAILGGFIAIARASRQTLATDFGVGVLMWALPLVLVVVWPHLALVFAVMLLLGVANPLVDVNSLTILQRLSPNAVMGRVMGAVETALIAGMAVGALMMPFLIRAVGVTTGVAVLGAVIAVATVPSFPRLRRLDEQLRPPAGLSLLGQLPVFAPLRPDVLDQLARELVRVEVAPGQEVISEGEPGDRFYVVDSGRVRATYQGRVLSEAGPGEPFGEIALLRDVPRTATVTALEATVLWALDRDPFLAAVTGSSEVRLNAEALAAKRIPTS